LDENCKTDSRKQNGENVIIVSFYANETMDNHLMLIKELKRDNSSGKFYIKNTSKNLSLVFNHLHKIKCHMRMSRMVETTKKRKMRATYFFDLVILKSGFCVSLEGVQFYPAKVVYQVRRFHSEPLSKMSIKKQNAIVW